MSHNSQASLTNLLFWIAEQLATSIGSVRTPPISSLRGCELVTHAWHWTLACGTWRLVAFFLPVVFGRLLVEVAYIHGAFPGTRHVTCYPLLIVDPCVRVRYRRPTTMDVATAMTTTSEFVDGVYKLKVADNPKYNILCASIGSSLIILFSLDDSNPLNGVTQEEARTFYKKYRVPVERGVFVRGVLALRTQGDIRTVFENIQDSRSKTPGPIELFVGEQRYTRLESEMLYKAFLPQTRWETLRSLSRLHRLLIVACIFAAVTQ